MTKFAHFDTDTGEILGFYVQGIHKNIPVPHLPISDADWLSHINGDAFQRANAARDGLEEYTPTAKPTYPTIEDARAAMVQWIDGIMTQIAGQVPEYERASWPTKAEAARAFVAGTARPDQIAMINAEATFSGRRDADLAAVIIARADAYELIVAQAAGLRVTLENALEAETDPMKYDSIFEDGKAQATAMAAALGIEIK